MSTRPITFMAEMVRALLAGTKTQTRRPVKPQPPGDFEEPYLDSVGRWWITENKPPDIMRRYPLHCPYGVPGDRLYVKEELRGPFKAHYVTDGHEVLVCSVCGKAGCDCNDSAVEVAWIWKRAILPARFCPRWASRLTLDLLSVRVERVQDISEEDARAEGVESRDAFRALWDRTYPAANWASNPWLWALGFRRVE